MLVTGTGAFDVDIAIGVGFNMLSMVRDYNSFSSMISCLVDFILEFRKTCIKIPLLQYITISIIIIVKKNEDPVIV